MVKINKNPLQYIRYYKNAISDVWLGLRRYDVWVLLGWAEIRQRYRRSVIGPLWITITMAVAICGVGPVYGILFNQNISSYVPYVSIGLVIWLFIGTIITETSYGFIVSEGYIKEFDLPLSIYIIRIVWKNFIILAHNFLVLLAILIFYPQDLGWSTLFLPIALVIIALNAIGVGLLIGVICTRFRDVLQIVSSGLQIIFFLTPIIWRTEMLGDKAWLMNLNPFYFFIEIVRAPLLGNSISPEVLIGVLVSTIITSTLGLLIFGRYIYRLVYWL